MAERILLARACCAVALLLIGLLLSAGWAQA